MIITMAVFFFFQAEDGIRDVAVTGVQTCALPIYLSWVRQGRFSLISAAANGTNATAETSDDRMSFAQKESPVRGRIFMAGINNANGGRKGKRVAGKGGVGYGGGRGGGRGVGRPLGIAGG